MAPDLPARVGPYDVVAALAARGGSPVFKAADPRGRAVAVKLLSPRLLAEPAAAERFEREARALARLEHPNLVRVLGSGEEGGRPYLAMEFVDAAPLDQLLRGRRLTPPEAIGVMKGICRGLAHAHQQGVVHRSLAPRDVLVSPDLATVKLKGFGVGRLEDLAMTGTLNTGALTLGAFHYLAPEQVDGRAAGAGAVDHRADLYAAGAICHEMLTGRAPSGKFALPSQANAELPPEADVLVLKCLARDPRQRYATAIDLLADLARLEEALRVRLLSELRGISRAGSKLLGAPRGGGRRRALLLAVLALLVVALVVAGLLLAR
jgi:serine/threonine protein kinase